MQGSPKSKKFPFPKAISEIPLLRALNLVQTTFLGVGTAIGGVMFAIMGKAAQAAGPSIIITFLIGAILALIVGLSYAELGASVPSGAGGAIAFVGRAFGKKMPTFIAGWFSWIGSITDCAIGSVVFALSVNYFLKWVEPFTLAIITLVIFTFINFRGTKSMSIIQFALTGVLVVTLCLFMASSSFSFEVIRFEPFFPQGVLPMLAMVSFIFPAYAGYESITQMSEEVKTAGKTIPRALLLTLTFITIFFTGAAIAMIGGAPPEVYANSSTPLQDAANYFIGPIGGIVVSIAGIVATLTTINGAMAGGTRIAFGLSRNDFLPSVFKKIHPKYRSPFAALALTALLAIAFVLTRSVDLIVYAISLGYSVTAIMVMLALLRLRKTEPNLYRPFRVPFYPYLPIISIVALSLMILTMSMQSLILGIAFGGIGLLLLFLGKRVKKRQILEDANG
ncbi:amino acid permease [Candidatus Bathyarchaeota archaeon]|nr:amino acid permease [Candidatus Bathyarchaeota archaeon]